MKHVSFVVEPIDLIKTVVGWGVLLIFLSIFIGVGAAVGLFIFSIICTAGIGLLIWIPLGFGVGWVVFDIFGWGDKESGAKSAEGSQQPETQSKASLTRKQQVLLNYIKKARTKGVSDDQISSDLKNNAWTADDINWAFNALK